MLKIAIYGKGGIGKSTTSCNLSAALAQQGLKVMQIGCDPKSDSCSSLLGGEQCPTVLDAIREKTGSKVELQEITRVGFGGIVCVESGGPIPGMGCAGRGIITAFEKLEELNAFDVFAPDVVIYDVLGDVVCGGFSMPMRNGYADFVYVVTSGEKMSLFAASNIIMAIDNFRSRGYSELGGIILNRKDVKDEYTSVQTLAQNADTKVVGDLPRSDAVQLAEEQGKTVIESFPNSYMADCYRSLAQRIMERSGYYES